MQTIQPAPAPSTRRKPAPSPHPDGLTFLGTNDLGWATWTVLSSDGRTHYTITRTPRGTFGCTCEFGRNWQPIKGTLCRHERACLADHEEWKHDAEETDVPDFDEPFTPREEILPMIVDADDDFEDQDPPLLDRRFPPIDVELFDPELFDGDPFGDPPAVTVSAPVEANVVWSDKAPIVDLSLLPLTERLAALSAFHGLDWRAS